MVVRRLRVAGRSGSGLGKNSAAVHHQAEQECQRRALRRPAHRCRQTGSQATGNRPRVVLVKDGNREELSWIEKKKAYGFHIKPELSVNGYKMTVVAAPTQP